MDSLRWVHNKYRVEFIFEIILDCQVEMTKIHTDWVSIDNECIWFSKNLMLAWLYVHYKPVISVVNDFTISNQFSNMWRLTYKLLQSIVMCDFI